MVRDNCDASFWRENLRMSRATFVQLVALLRPHMSPSKNYVRAPVPLDKRVAIAVCQLATCGEYRVVGNMFGVHKATVHNCVYLFCNVVTKRLLKQFVKMPDAAEAIFLAQRFEQRCKLPQVIGAIDGTHIPVLPPSSGYRDFINRKGWPSLVLQAVVDSSGRYVSFCNRWH